MTDSEEKKWIMAGLKSAQTAISYQNSIWSRYSNDKVDIGVEVADVFKNLFRHLPSLSNIRALSIGCGYEPQFRLLQALCDDTLYLLDLDQDALNAIKERIQRQSIKGVFLLYKNFRIFLDAKQTEDFLNTELDGKPVKAIFLHHLLYYCEMSKWNNLIRNLFNIVLGPKGAIHCVLMACESDNRSTTTWLYNYFAGRFCNHHNNQDILKFSNQLKKDLLFKRANITTKTTQVRFFVDNFEQVMAVIWMILLYPSVHQYSDSQKKKIIQHIYREFFLPKKALIQNQNHMVIYKNLCTGQKSTKNRTTI